VFVCQWSLDIVYGKQREALAVMKEWGAEKFRSSAFARARGARVLTGFIGESGAHVVDEYLFESLADFEAALADMAQPQFKEFSERLAPYVVPGTQKWVVWRVVE